MTKWRFFSVVACLAGCGAGVWGASGQELALEIGQSGSAEFEDLVGVAMKQSVYSIAANHFVRGREGQLAVEGSLAWVDVDWTGNPLGGDVGALYERGERAAVSGLWTRSTEAAVGYSVFAGIESARARDGMFRPVGFTEALGFNLGATVNLRTASKVVVGVGLLYTPAIVESDREWLPIVQIYWPINDQWTLQTRNGIVLSWSKDAVESRTIAVSALWNSQEWHLGKAEGREYSIENEGLSLGLRYGWKWGQIRIEPSIQVTIAGESTIWNEAGRVLESDLDTFLSADLKISHAF